jgi:hypothetical protein
MKAIRPIFDKMDDLDNLEFIDGIDGEEAMVFGNLVIVCI